MSGDTLLENRTNGSGNIVHVYLKMMDSQQEELFNILAELSREELWL
jgi:hypothetical protein